MRFSLQTARIKERIAQFGGKLYLEFGGKLFDDYHASRVLPGFEPDTKFRMLSALANDMEILIAVSAEDIERGKVRGDLGITYDGRRRCALQIFSVPKVFLSAQSYLHDMLLSLLPTFFVAAFSRAWCTVLFALPYRRLSTQH